MGKKSRERREKFELIHIQKLRKSLMRKARFFDYVNSDHYLNRREHGLFVTCVQKMPLLPNENNHNAYVDLHWERFESSSFGAWVKNHDTRYNGYVLELETICSDDPDDGWNKTEDEILAYERRFIIDQKLENAKFNRHFMDDAVVIVADDIAKTVDSITVGLHDDNWETNPNNPIQLLKSKISQVWLDYFKTPLIPPFDSMFIEYSDFNYSDEYDTWYFGCYISTLFLPDGTIQGFTINPMNSLTHPELQLEQYKIYIDENGILTNVVFEDNLQPDGIKAGFVALKIIALMNCKNIEIIDNEPETEFAKEYRIYMGKNPTKFKTLKLKLMGKRSKSGLPKEYQGLMPLHLRRGNFATYTEDAPLFGKFTGTFWRPATAVGEAKNGTVIKDYKVIPE